MRLGAFELTEPFPELKEPHALAMLRPWVDVGSVGALILSWLEKCLEAKELGSLARPGDFFDFTRYRPTVHFKGEHRQVIIPNTYVTYSQREAENDFLFLHLLEPHSHGETYVESLLELLSRFGVKRYCLIGSMYDLVPHTKPLPVSGGGIGKHVKDELKKMGIEPSNYQGPTAITTLISQEAPNMDMETMSLIVHLPQYTQLDEDYIGAVRIMEVLVSLYAIIPDESYNRKARQQFRQINRAIDKDPQLKAVVEHLETQYEARFQQKAEEASQLSPEVEKFLKEMERRFKEGQH